MICKAPHQSTMADFLLARYRLPPWNTLLKRLGRYQSMSTLHTL